MPACDAVGVILFFASFVLWAHAEQVRLTGHHVPGPPVETSRSDLDEYLVLTDVRPRDLREA